MIVVRHLILSFTLLLFAALGVSAAFAAQGDWSLVSYPVEVQDLDAQQFNLTFTARAPPSASEKLASTGIALTRTGGARVLDDAGTTGVVSAFAQSSIATNKAVTRVGDGPLPTGRQTLDPTEISFSQATVSGRTSDGLTHDELVAAMRRDGWQGDPVDVVNMPDGAPTSMDNRRLLAAREAGIPIEADVRNASDPLTSAQADRFEVVGQPRPTNWGEAIQLRTQRQGGMQGVDPSWPERLPNGSIYDPDIVGGQ